MSAQMSSIAKMLSSINAITLRSGTTLEEVEPKPIKLAEDVPNVEVSETMEIDEDEKEEVAKEEEKKLKAKEPKRKNNLEEQIPIPFPTVAKKAKKHEELDPNKVQIFKNVEVTIPLFNAIRQVSKYVKFLKDVCTHNEKIGGLVMNLLGNSISSLMDDFPEKYCHPSPCLKKLNLAPLKRSGARFVLADKSIISVVGIAENVLISQFKLDTFSGNYSFEAKGKVVKFKLEETMRQPLEVHSIFGCDIVEHNVVEENFGSDGEISVNRDLGIRGVSKEKGEDPQLPNSQGNKAPEKKVPATFTNPSTEEIDTPVSTSDNGIEVIKR
ncbi:hypothetical protein AHAS_Ahas16G0178000 [Arachis hypogaea]